MPCIRRLFDLVDMFLTLAEKYEWILRGRCIASGTQKLERPRHLRKEARINIDIISELQGRYGHREASAGWYVAHEIWSNNAGTIDLFIRQGGHAKKVSGGKPTLISPYFAGVKAHAGVDSYRALTLEEHVTDWENIFSQLSGTLDYVHSGRTRDELYELPTYLNITKKWRTVIISNAGAN